MGRKSNKAKEKKQARLAERAAMDAVCAKVDAANKTTSSRAKRCMTISGCRLVFRKIRTWSLPSHYSICMSDVADNVHKQSQTKRSNLIKNTSSSTNNTSSTIKITLQAPKEPVFISRFSCSCAARRDLCDLVALLFQIAHYTIMVKF